MDVKERGISVGVLGGGLQGCCTALALAERGLTVVLFDRRHGLLERTAVANEGKIHLGYMYAGDPTLSTARMMMEGALAFAPFMQRYLGLPIDALGTSIPAAYVVHRDSQHSAQFVTAYMAEVHRLVMQAATGRELAYFGFDLSTPPRLWTAQQRDAAFNSEMALTVLDTQEVAINPVTLAAALRTCVSEHPRIETRLNRYVEDLPALLQTSARVQALCAENARLRAANEELKSEVARRRASPITELTQVLRRLKRPRSA